MLAQFHTETSQGPASTRPPIRPRLTVPSFELHDLRRSIDLSAVSSAIDGIGRDPYFAPEGGERCKAIVRLCVDGERIQRQPHGPLFQSLKFNPVHGDLVRHYPELSPDVVASAAVRRIVLLFARRAGLSPSQEIMLQAQRIRCLDGGQALPSVEGWHQDGTRTVGIVVVSRTHVRGGVTQISTHGGRTAVFTQTLQPGQMILFDDRRFWHRTTPIEPADPRRPSYRDVLLLSYPSGRLMDPHEEASAGFLPIM
jgi:hypothetical protein